MLNGGVLWARAPHARGTGTVIRDLGVVVGSGGGVGRQGYIYVTLTTRCHDQPYTSRIVMVVSCRDL